MISVEGCIKGDNYKKVISFVLENSDAVMLIFQSYGHPFKKSLKAVRSVLKPFRIASRNNHKTKEDGFRWPGTISWDENSLIHADTYRLSEEVKKYILSADDIFSWIYPGRPEDISFFCNGECWLSTTAHEELCDIFDHESEIKYLLDSLGIEYTQMANSCERFVEKYSLEQ